MKKTLRLIAVLSLLLCLALAACDMGTPGANPVESGTQAGTQAGNQTDRPSNGRPDGPSEDGTWDTSSPEGNKPPEAFDTEPETEPVTAPPSITGPDHEFTPGGPSVTGPSQETEPAPHEHSFGDWMTVREPTCSQTGEQQRVCACGVIDTQAIGTLDHTVVKDDAIAPTCTELGWTEGEHCAVCSYVISAQNSIPAYGHNWGEWYESKAPTETEQGEKRRDCEVCDAFESSSIAELSHSHDRWDTVTLEAVEPTCTQNGLTEGKACAGCGEILVAQERIYALGHTIGETVVEEGSAPSCTWHGYYYNVTYCAVCDAEIYRDSVWIDALGHTEVLDEAILPTCITDGVTKGSHCSVCEQELNGRYTVPATGFHVYVDEVCKYCSAVIVYSEGLEFTSNGDGTCFVSGIGSCTDSIIVIPKTSPEGDVVTKIGEYAFYYEYDLVGVNIPTTVTSIDQGAFMSCHSLNYVDIPDSVTSIGSEAFRSSGLKYLIVPGSLTDMGEGVFSNCDSLENVVLLDGITEIGYGMFDHCDYLASVTIPDSVKSIGDHAFDDCMLGEGFIIPDGVTSIGERAFYHVGLGEHFVIPDSVTNIGPYAFQDAFVGSVTLSNGITSISEGMFDSARLESIVIPDSVTSIESCAFDGCSNLTSITISESVTSIGSYAFRECTALTSVIIPNGVIEIGESAFYWCTSLTSISFGNSIKSIGKNAF